MTTSAKFLPSITADFMVSWVLASAYCCANFQASGLDSFMPRSIARSMPRGR